jgi:integrase
MQRGYIFKLHGAWHLRYRVNGKQVCQRLAPFGDKFRTEKSVRSLAEEILQPLNDGRQPSGPQTLKSFIELSYFAHAREHKRPSTFKGYSNLYKRYIAPRVGGLRVREFRTVDGQRLLDAIASGGELSENSLSNIKTFLSAVFAFAKRMGALDDFNPMDSTSVPKGKETQPTYAYSLQEVNKIVKALKGPARTAVIVAAWTGLSLAELRGLQWADVESGHVTVRRTCWHRSIGPTKTDARNAPVPLLPVVSKALADHRKHNPGTTFIFEGPRQFPIDLATLGSKGIKPALEGSGVEWYGWHALRRGFATNLHAAGVQDKIIQSLLRHSSLAVTMGYYVKPLPAASVEAMQRLRRKSK